MKKNDLFWATEGSGEESSSSSDDDTVLIEDDNDIDPSLDVGIKPTEDEKEEL